MFLIRKQHALFNHQIKNQNLYNNLTIVKNIYLFIYLFALGKINNKNATEEERENIFNENKFYYLY